MTRMDEFHEYGVGQEQPAQIPLFLVILSGAKDLPASGEQILRSQKNAG